MKILIVTDQRFICKNGKYYTEKVFQTNLKRYQTQFGDVSVYAKTGKSMFKSSAEVEDFDIYLGGGNVSLYSGKNIHKFEKIISEFDLIILRVPSILAFQAAGVAQKKQIPYMAVVVGCVFDAFWNHGFYGKILAPMIFMKMRNVVKKSSYASYVTEKFLQNRYPCAVKSVAVSDVDISLPREDVLQSRFRKIESLNTKEIKIMTAAALNVKYKGQQYVIKAIPILNKMGIYVKYYVAGTGKSDYLEKIAEKCNVSEQVIVMGSIPHEKVLQLMDEVDIYIQPSLQEGLPRAVVEALSRGLPCVGTGTGGIPELIPEECIFEKKSSESIANVIRSILKKNMLKEISQRNWNRAKEFSNDILERKRNEYFQYVIDDIESPDSLIK